ncbi:unnamed protein product [Sphenostylis stenocarpa]|uniref:Uncharacterized protein n=1 Tax=Sphenostylis stenocarpa TaxID=92480 RepID=A0AA86VL47_9FABA|nr:unnamed protein product [Sphenostylis stenocarpa]
MDRKVPYGINSVLTEKQQRNGVRSKLFGEAFEPHRALRFPEVITGYGVPRIASYISKIFCSEGFRLIRSPLEHHPTLAKSTQQTKLISGMLFHDADN